MQGSQEDHCDHTREEKHNHKGVQDRKPLDVGVWHALQNVIPSTAPLHVVLHVEGDGVAVGDGGVHGPLPLDRQSRLQSFRVATLIVVMCDGSEKLVDSIVMHNSVTAN